MRSFILILLSSISIAQAQSVRTVVDFNKGWQFHLFDSTELKDAQPGAKLQWRNLDLPHDWSIEGPFSKDHLTTNQQAALPGGIALYKKSFRLTPSELQKNIAIEFDGVFCNSEVYVNGTLVGKRPNGYISFQYNISKYLKPGVNLVTVKVDNMAQPSSRWYTGSGIYRNVRLVYTNNVAIDHWGTFVTTPAVLKESAVVKIDINIRNKAQSNQFVHVETRILNETGKMVANTAPYEMTVRDTIARLSQQALVMQPELWSTDRPYLYKAVTTISDGKNILDQYTTTFGIRYFSFDAQKGFSLNGKPMKILGVCMHHDLGALGAAVNVRAMERQLQILKDMGCNAIRTAHNPPAPELLDLCDKMGFLVMDEAFDIWKKRKTRFDYHLHFDSWHKRDLEDMVKRDRNHPSVFMWSVGNEIREQFDSTGIRITRELVQIVKQLDTSRPVTAALTETDTLKNFMYQANALDVIGLNYNHAKFEQLPNLFPGKKIIASETTSGLASRGDYDLPSDSIKYWPARGEKYVSKGNADFSVSAYDHVAAYWGSTHEETWKKIKKLDFISGLFVWTGFDYLGEPTPYPWPARSSYFGIVDIAGFPKDVYYMYQSEWTTKPVLHIFPHWNWTPGTIVDVWGYYNNADEVELFLNNRSLGIRKKHNDELHVQWKIPFEPGTLTAISRKNGQAVLTKTIKTASEPARIELTADRDILHAGSNDLSFITVRILDKNGNPVPDASSLVNFSGSGEGVIEALDNGYPAGGEPFKAAFRKVYNGMALVIIRSTSKKGTFRLTASSDGLAPATIALKIR
jgi:beta-galactosidase